MTPVVGTTRNPSRAKRPTRLTPALLAFAALAITGHAVPALAEEPAAGAPAPKLLNPTFSDDGALLVDLRGGARRGGTYIGNAHVRSQIDGAAVALPGATAYVDLMNLHGGHPGSRVGDAQGVSNLSGPNGTQVEELWLQYNAARSSTSWLIGIYDLNSEFYRLLAAGLFLASPFGIGAEFAQSGVDGPSIFPRTSAGIRFAIKPTAQTVLRVAVLDGVPVVRSDGSRAFFKSGDGLLGVAEFAFLQRPDKVDDNQVTARDRSGRLSSLYPYRSKLAVGAWHYTARFDDLSDVDRNGDPKRIRGSSGAYLAGEQPLLGDDGSRGKKLSGFAQFGVADARVNRFGSYLGLGLVASGWEPMRGSDEIGVAMARAHNGAHDERGQIAVTSVAPNRAETTFELTYLTQASTHFAVQPALQYVRHPNTDPSLRGACVFQLRFEIAY